MVMIKFVVNSEAESVFRIRLWRSLFSVKLQACTVMAAMESIMKSVFSKAWSLFYNMKVLL